MFLRQMTTGNGSIFKIRTKMRRTTIADILFNEPTQESVAELLETKAQEAAYRDILAH